MACVIGSSRITHALSNLVGKKNVIYHQVNLSSCQMAVEMRVVCSLVFAVDCIEIIQSKMSYCVSIIYIQEAVNQV